MFPEVSDRRSLDFFKLDGQVSLITGGARGIGLATAIGFAEAGSNIAITYNSSNKEHLATVAAKFEELGVKYKAYQCNVVNQQEIIDTAEQVFKDFGRLDIVVANAGVADHTPALDFETKDYYFLNKVNIDGSFFTAQAAAKVFKKEKELGILKQGKLIFTASVSSSVVNIPQKQACYNMTKAAVAHLARSLAIEWIDFARVNSVSPGYISTEMVNNEDPAWLKKWNELTPAGRLCQPYELKGAYLFLASDASSYVTGTELFVHGGYSLT